MAVEEASLRIEIDSISAGLMSLRSETASMIPSTTMSGSFDASIERVPRIRIDVVAPGSPDVDMISAPATRPWIAWSIDVTGASRTSPILTLATEPVRSDFLTLPYPITTTSSSFVEALTDITISSSCLPSGLIFTSSKPRK